MNTKNKVGNVLCIILAWILSVALVLMLLVTPILLSALSLLNAGTITKAVTDALTQSLTPSQEQTSAGYGVTNLSTGTQTTGANAAQGVLEEMLGDQVSPDVMEKLLTSNAVKEFVQTYTGDLANAFTGSSKAPQFNAEKVKAIINDNMDEIIAIAKEVKPDLSEDEIAKLKDTIRTKVDEKAEEIVQALPKPEELKNQIMESSPELEMIFQVLAMKNTIKLAIIGAVVLVSALIFLCRFRGFRGLRWLAVDLFVGGGMNALVSAGLLLGASAAEQVVTDQPVIAGLITSLIGSFATGVTVRTVVMLLAGGALLTAYLFIKKTINNPKYDIIVLAGQSNAEGQGIGPVSEEYVPDKRVMLMKDDTNFKFVNQDGKIILSYKWPAENIFEVAQETVKPKGQLGCFGFWFAKKYADTYLEKGRKVLIVKACHGGTGFSRPEWGLGNIMHERMISMTKTALAMNKHNRVVALLWAQGEHDSFENADWDPEKRYITHKANITATFHDFYEKVGDSSIPLITCGFPDTFCQSCPEASEAVLKAIKEVVADFGGSYVDTAGLLSNAQKVESKDIYHFCKESLYILGGKFFEKYTQMREVVETEKV